MRVELVYFTGCPNVALMRELLARCLARLGRAIEIIEVNTDTVADGDSYRGLPSPTVLVDGVGVLDSRSVGAMSCRLKMPTEDELMCALGGRDEKTERAAVPAQQSVPKMPTTAAPSAESDPPTNVSPYLICGSDAGVTPDRRALRRARMDEVVSTSSRRRPPK